MIMKSRKLLSLSISFSFSVRLNHFLQLAFTNSNSTVKTQEEGLQ